jgi:hypothetical protein
LARATTRQARRVKAFGNAFDHAPLAGVVAALADHGDLEAFMLDPLLHFGQFGLQVSQFLFVGFFL